ncbi:UNVERIFIED_CONTAM: protein NRT1/ PTR FAMILY 4.4 [Sesamum calycinum]|uniref:Protein NRT1/ PTR FAMILY 4.4 n=1 Tax=Sesamum calycinum TaxID=2727403 RepID=A0AAW2PB43_9LAMI
MKMGVPRNFNIQNKQQARQGGRRATIFVFAMAALETMAFLSNGVSLVTYFYGYMNFSLTKSATTLTNFMGTAFLLSLFGGFISDTYFSRFKTCVIFGCLEILRFNARQYINAWRLLSLAELQGNRRKSYCLGRIGHVICSGSPIDLSEDKFEAKRYTGVVIHVVLDADKLPNSSSSIGMGLVIRCLCCKLLHGYSVPTAIAGKNSFSL